MNFEKIREEDGRFCEWLLYENYQYTRPVCVLSNYDVRKLLAAFAEVDPVYVRQIASNLIPARPVAATEGKA